MGWSSASPSGTRQPDEGLVGGHEWKIFPLLHQPPPVRRTWSTSYLFDFYRADGSVDENVFAYSNRFNERDADWSSITTASPIRAAGSRPPPPIWTRAPATCDRRSLAEGLGLPYEGYVIFRDYVTHLEYIRSCEELWQKGLYFELAAYQCHTFLDWRFVGEEGWDQVYAALGGSGVESVQAKWDELFAPKKEKPAPKKPRAPRKTTAKPKVSAKKKTGPKVEPVETADTPAVKPARKPRKVKTD